MCYILVINRGEKEIQTPGEFQAHFGFDPIPAFGYTSINPNHCLCQCDLDRTFAEHGIPFKTDWGDYYVGQLELIKGDESLPQRVKLKERYEPQ